MKRRQYAIIIEDGITIRVEEINTIKEAIDVIHPETYGFFWYEEDSMPSMCIDTNNFKGLKEYLFWLNYDKYHPSIKIYVDALNKLSRVKHLRQLRPIIEMFNRMFKGINRENRLYLNSINYKEYKGKLKRR